MLTQTYNIDMIPSGVPLALHISQYDVGLTTLVFNPYVSVGTMDFSVVTEAYLEATKPDMRAIVHACTVGDGTITYTVQEQLAAVSGRVYSKLVLKDASGDVVASKAILWLVEPAGVADDAILSDSDLSGVSQVIQASTNFNDAVPTQTVSGEVLTFDDAVEGAPLEELVLHIEPHQSGSGDPSPSNIRPISGYDAVNVYRTGKNLYRYPYATATKTQYGITWTVNGDGSITVNGTATSTAYFNLTVWDDDYVPLLRTTGAELTITGGTSDVRIFAQYREEGSTTSVTMGIDNGSGVTFTVPEGVNTYISYLRVNNGVTVDNVTIRPMIRLASIPDDTYEPYQGTIYPISLSAAGTVYGGTLNVTTGELVVDKGYTTVNDITWYYDSTYTRFYGSIPDVIIGIGTRRTPFICSAYQTIDDGRALGSVPDGSIYGAGNIATIYIKDTRYTASATFKSEMGDVQIVYPLNTPVTYHLTPTGVTTLLGDNTIWMDAEGTIDASYKVRLSSYFMALRAMLAPVEATYTATANYAVGDYLIVGTVLYKVTAAITSGETIAEGSNVTATTVMTEIKALQ